ncbi:hypothetical protein LguiB_017773 [Lonicera macranthoides]
MLDTCFPRKSAKLSILVSGLVDIFGPIMLPLCKNDSRICQFASDYTFAAGASLSSPMFSFFTDNSAKWTLVLSLDIAILIICTESKTGKNVFNVVDYEAVGDGNTNDTQLAYLPFRRQDLILDDENIDLFVSLDSSTEILDVTLKEGKKTRKHGLLNWLKLFLVIVI